MGKLKFLFRILQGLQTRFASVMTCHFLEEFNFALTSELWWSHSCSSLFSHPTEWQCAFCPESWLLFNTKCYYFSTNKLTWNKSRDFCTSMGGHLVIIESEEEQNFLLNTTAKTMDKSYWIGLTDQKIENKFFWVNNESLNENKKLKITNFKDKHVGYHLGQCSSTFLHQRTGENRINILWSG
uniref:C-type lectin domain-containing protein n=1 Tax=Erpetoichthys calabaricus TaxID=27687 RepID=A0A8C4T6H5_ERPCA